MRELWQVWKKSTLLEIIWRATTFINFCCCWYVNTCSQLEMNIHICLDVSIIMIDCLPKKSPVFYSKRHVTIQISPRDKAYVSLTSHIFETFHIFVFNNIRYQSHIDQTLSNLVSMLDSFHWVREKHYNKRNILSRIIPNSAVNVFNYLSPSSSYLKKTYQHFFILFFLFNNWSKIV